MGLLFSLGINSTILMQLGIFIAVFFVLKYVLFEPYFKAFNARTEATVGQTDLAERYIAETKELENQFAVKAQAANEKARVVYDQTRVEAVKEYDRVVADARSRAKMLTENAHQKIQNDVEGAKAQLSKEVPGVAKLLVQKLIGKDLTT